MTPGTDLVRHASIEELCGHRARALECFRQAYELLVAGVEAQGRAVVGTVRGDGLSPDMQAMLRYPSPENLEWFLNAATKNLDRKMWHGFIVGTPLGGLMDRQERKAFEESLEKDPPEATPDTVYATMSKLAGEADVIFRRGLVNTFRGLCRDYRSHDGFKIGPRVILTHTFSVTNLGGGYMVHLNEHSGSLLHDVDRVFHVLDGQPAPEYQRGLCATIRVALRQDLWEAETEHMRCRWFQNGNAHLWFKRADLVKRANKLIAEHYGEVLGVGPDSCRDRAPGAI